MSQSASLYRIRGYVFRELEATENRKDIDFYSRSKEVATFEGTFMALELSYPKDKMIK